MQKLDYIQALEVIKEELLVDKLYAFFTEKTSSGTKLYRSCMPDLLTVHINYTNMVNGDDSIAEVLSLISGLQYVFDSQNFAKFVTHVANTTDINNMQTNYAKSFILAYKFVIDLYYVNKNILLKDDISTNEDDELKQGLIIFRAKIDEDIQVEKFTQIFKAISELIETVCKLYQIQDKPTIVLLDSGSDTNIGVRTSVGVAQDIYKLFQEVFDYIVNWRFARHDREMRALVDGLSIREKINAAKENHIITEEEAREYTHLVKSRTDKLIGLGVAPRKVLEDTIKTTGSNGWLAFKAQYLLEEHQQNGNQE